MQDVADGTGNITIGSGNRVKFIGSTGAGGAHTHTFSDPSSATNSQTPASHTHGFTLGGSTAGTNDGGTINATAAVFSRIPPAIVENVLVKT
jgi:hypothetical protein